MAIWAMKSRETIIPALESLRAQGLDIQGPFPADTLFTPRHLAGVDAVLAMYHDQGLAVLKYAGFGQAANITLGLPLVRTSVDHGTALDLAGKGVADCTGSFARCRYRLLGVLPNSAPKRPARRNASTIEKYLQGILLDVSSAPAAPSLAKRFGQNFLRDLGIISRIVRSIGPREGDRLVEIGPGQGALTAPLLEAAGKLEVIELDRDLIPGLRVQFFNYPDFIIHEGDALKFDFAALKGDGPALRVVGNLPYNISTPLIVHLLTAGNAVADMHFMLQKEVVERLAAQPGGT